MRSREGARPAGDYLLSGPVLLTAATRKLRPWKNGGGHTSEVISFPTGSGLNDFGWRVSIAVVDADGPFSVFPMVERHIVVLAGALRLSFDDHDRVISAGDVPFSFPGGSAVVGRLIDGPVRDLNLMVQSDRYAGCLRVVGPGSSRAASPSTVILTPQAATILIDETMLELHAEDALLVTGPANIESASTLILAEIRPLP